MSGVEQELNELADALGEQRELLQEGLDTITTELTGERAYQWSFSGSYEGLGVANGEVHTWTTPIYVARMNGLTDFEPAVGAITQWPVAPMVAGPWKILDWVKEDYPEAVEARDEWDRKLPQVRQYSNDQDVDIDELIEFPRQLGAFYNGWHTIRSDMSGLHQHLEDIKSHSDHGTWRGEAADSYSTIIRSQQRGAEAVHTGIGNALEHIGAISQKAVDTCNALMDLATDSANDAIDFAQEIINFTPSQWLSTVNNLVDRMQEINEEHVDEVQAELQSIQNDVEWKTVVDTQFADLQVILGGPEMAWPPADGRGIWD